MGLKAAGGRRGALTVDEPFMNDVADVTGGGLAAVLIAGTSMGLDSLGILLGGCWAMAATWVCGLEDACIGFVSNLRLVAVSGFFEASNTGGEDKPDSASFGLETDVTGSQLFSGGG